MTKLTVSGAEITVISKDKKDFISLTDMVKKSPDGLKLIEKWLSNKNTIEFLWVWERLNNPNFNSPEIGGILLEAGSNRFTMSVKRWVATTGAVGIFAKTGRDGGTYAHKDIAFEFGTWISPEFKLLLIKEFQDLKEKEQERLGSEWDYRRFLSKVNYKILTDAVKEKLIPLKNLPKEKEGIVYAEEAELLNFALFNMTSKEWKARNPREALQGRNIRDYADAHELIVMSNLEAMDAQMIRRGHSPQQRLPVLRNAAIDQLESLRASQYTIAKIQSPFKQVANSSGDARFNKELSAMLRVPPPKRDAEQKAE